MPRLTIITPTLVRATLPRLLASIDSQTDPDWEHLLAVDLPQRDLTPEQLNILTPLLQDPRRHVHMCGENHGHYGHVCRRILSQKAKGTYVLYLDDDDYLADRDVFRTLRAVESEWAVFPVLREGHRLFCHPPGRCRTTLSSFIVRRDLAEFPELPGGDDYQLDGLWVEELFKHYYPETLNTRPLVVIPRPNAGAREIEI